MLKSLNIENIAIIESVSVDFQEGLNILTGETGAGKSIIIDSINAVTGEKTSRDLIRTGENSANVSALFENISPEINEELSENALPAEPDGTLLLQRKLTRDGKNVCRINGASVTVSMLKKFGLKLINIHGQRDSQELLDSDRHIDFLDGYAKDEKELEAYRESFAALKKLSTEIKSLQTDEEYKARQIDILTYQINELKNAEIIPGERERLHRQKTISANSEKVKNALIYALNCLNGDVENGGACALISDASSEIISVSSYAKGLDILSDTLSAAAARTEEASSLIEDVLNQISDSENDLDSIEQRLDFLYRLSKKYGETEEDMIEFLKNAETELENINSCDERLEKLQAEYEILYKETVNKAEILSGKRKKTQSILSSAVMKELSYLDMPSCRFSVEMSSVFMNDKGIDSVEFFISANRGEELKPLNKVASGGELSRIMLAMKNVLNSENGAGTLIFDEIDAGVSGSAAKRIAEKLSEVSRNTQVLCITHLAQIAAFADGHKYIYKEVSDGKTFTRIKNLSKTERPYELARITSGGAPEKIQVEAAGQMIEDAVKIKGGR